jgi:hypothetical protein
MTAMYTRPPRAVRWISAILTRLMNLGLPLGPMRLLEGPRTVPVELISFDGHDWLVSLFGETGWVRRARKTGEVRLRRGRRAETFTATEVHGQQSDAVIERMRRQVRMNPFASQALRAEHAHPVFQLERLGVSGSGRGGV